jgi:hypothetical protein
VLRSPGPAARGSEPRSASRLHRRGQGRSSARWRLRSGVNGSGRRLRSGHDVQVVERLGNAREPELGGLTPSTFPKTKTDSHHLLSGIAMKREGLSAPWRPCPKVCASFSCLPIVLGRLATAMGMATLACPLHESMRQICAIPPSSLQILVGAGEPSGSVARAWPVRWAAQNRRYPTLSRHPSFWSESNWTETTDPRFHLAIKSGLVQPLEEIRRSPIE